MSAALFILVFVVGAALLAAPLWSTRLPPSDYPLVIVLGCLFAAFGAYAALPERFSRLRTLVFVLALGAFGTVCTALTLTPFKPDANGYYSIGGVARFTLSGPMPWWARIVTGFFALVMLGVAVMGLWGLLRDAVSGRRDREAPGDNG
jgi:hypothetical protein